jgi:hypothetical protein
VESWQATAATESEARSKLKHQFDEKSELVVAAAAEAEVRQRAAEEEHQRLRMLLVDATREVQAASQGNLLESCNFLLRIIT